MIAAADNDEDEAGNSESGVDENFTDPWLGGEEAINNEKRWADDGGSDLEWLTVERREEKAGIGCSG